MVVPTTAPTAVANGSEAPPAAPTVAIAAPSATVTPVATAPGTAAVVINQAVPVMPYYIAFAAPSADREPTDDEYLLITQLTTLYFEEIFAAVYTANQTIKFVQVDTVLDSAQYQAGIPEAKFNIYMAFNTSIIFAPDSALPSATDLFDIMDEAIGTSYVVNYVWQAPETPFVSTQEAVLNPLALDIIPVKGKMANSPDVYSQLQGRFILPGSKISASIFRPHKSEP